MRAMRGLINKAACIAVLTGCAAAMAFAQGSRKDDIVLNAAGKPVAGATITVCVGDSNVVPCTPLATLYTDATLTVQSPNPFQADGLGNYHFYAAPGRYTIQIGGSGISPQTYEDTILPNDPTEPSFSSVTATGSISASTLSLGGNLSVAGSATINGSENVVGTLTAGSFSLTNFMPSSLTVTGNETIQGPKPRVDVTAYGAKGDGVTDDTSAIQAAINAACQDTSGGGGVIFFPPTNQAYALSQPQNPSTAPVLSISSCTSTGVTFEGGGSPAGAQQQFARSPMTRIGVLKLGSSPNLAPVFLVGTGNVDVTFRNLSIFGYNQAIQAYNTVGLVLDNMGLAVGNAQGGATNCTTVDCTSDNTPLAIYSSFWIWVNQTALQAGPTGGYATVFANSNSANTTGLVRLDKVTTAGGGFLFDQRDTSSMATGNYEFHTVAMEGASAEPFFTILNSNGGSATRNIGPFIFEDSAAYDCTNGTPFLRMNAAHTNLATLLVKNSDGCNASAPLQVQAGNAYNVVVEGNSFQSRIPVDGSGNPLGPAETDNQNGRDYITPTLDTNRLRTDYTNCCGVGTGSDGSPIRMAPSGGVQSTVALDPGQAAGQGGLLFGDGVNAGYNANLLEQTSGGDDTLDVAFAQATPPTGLSATAGSSGSCTAGTYYYVVTAYSGSAATTSTASNEANATVGASGSVALSWTPAIGPNITGYQITRSTISEGEFFGGKQYEVTGAGANSFTDTCASTSSGSVTFWNQTFAAFHRFSQRKLGVDNVSPAAQLDVVAQDASTVGFSVKAAASPSTNVWQVLNSGGTAQAYIDGGFNVVAGGHENRTAANSDTAGTLTITSSSSGTKTFAPAYSNAPACVASPQSNLGTTTWWVTTTASAMTINLSVSSTASFFYSCTGNPN
jgi:Pectate lyase superfamily protein